MCNAAIIDEKKLREIQAIADTTKEVTVRGMKPKGLVESRAAF